MFWISAMEMRWFYRSIFYCKLLLTCNGFLSPSRFSLLTGIHWTDTQVVQSQNKSCFMMRTVTVDLALVAGSSASVEGFIMLCCHPTTSPEPSQWLVKPYGCSKLRLSGEALGGGALHQEIAGTLRDSPPCCSWQLWAAGAGLSKLEGASS